MISHLFGWYLHVKFRAAGFPSTSKSSVCWDPLQTPWNARQAKRVLFILQYQQSLLTHFKFPTLCADTRLTHPHPTAKPSHQHSWEPCALTETASLIFVSCCSCFILRCTFVFSRRTSWDEPDRAKIMQPRAPQLGPNHNPHRSPHRCSTNADVFSDQVWNRVFPSTEPVPFPRKGLYYTFIYTNSV